MFPDLPSTLRLLIAFNGLAFGTVLAALALRGRATNPAIPVLAICLSALMILNLFHSAQGNTRLTELRFAVPLLIGPSFLLFVRHDGGRPLPKPGRLLLHGAPAVLMAIAVMAQSTPDRLLPFIILIHIGGYVAYAATAAAREGAGLWTYLLTGLGASAIALNIASLAAGKWAEGLSALTEASLFAVLLAMVCALIVAGLLAPATLFRQAVERLQASSGAQLDDAEACRLASRIEALLSEERPHLDPGFRLGDLARRLREPERRVSQAINQAFGLNVPDFLNQHRVGAVQERLANPAERATLLEIAFDCGFNSKATFNRAFTRHTGSTPSRARAIKPERPGETSHIAF